MSATVVVRLARVDGTRIAGPFAFARADVASSVHFTGPVGATVVVRLARVDGTFKAGPLAFAVAAVKIRKQPAAMWRIFTCTVPATVVACAARVVLASVAPVLALASASPSGAAPMAAASATVSHIPRTIPGKARQKEDRHKK